MTLVLLNGAPGVGKSTVASLLAEQLPGVALDVDVVKHALPSWPDAPERAGFDARRRVLAAASTALAEGRVVVIGQYLARPEFAEQLAALARSHGVAFVDVLLTVPVDELARRLDTRRVSPSRPEHAVNGALVSPADAETLVASLVAMGGRPSVQIVDATGDAADVAARVAALLRSHPTGSSARGRP